MYENLNCEVSSNTYIINLVETLNNKAVAKNLILKKAKKRKN